MDIRYPDRGWRWTLACLAPQNVGMYLPSHFAESRPEVLHALMRAHPLATLAWLGPDGLAAEHLPLELEAGAGPGGLGILRGHVARANPVWQQALADQEVLLVFQGPQAYVSPSWYPSKAEHGKVVPTWNYVVVHARGRLLVRDDPAWVHDLVSRLTAQHESALTKPWAVADAPPDYVSAMTRAIVGIEVPIHSLTGKWKVSQNRSPVDRAGVQAGLAARADAQSQAMAPLVPGPIADGAA